MASSSMDPYDIFNSPKETDGLPRTLTSDELQNRNHLCHLIYQTTHGAMSTNGFQELKCLCLKSDELTLFGYKILFDILHKYDSQIRLSALQICNHLFRCSKVFRKKLIEDLSDIFPLVLKGDPFFCASLELPPPEYNAKLLSRTAMLMINQWFYLYGNKPKFMRLRIAYRYVCALYTHDTGTNLWDVEPFTPPNSFCLSLLDPLHFSSDQANNLAVNKIDALTLHVDDRVNDMATNITNLESSFQLLGTSDDMANMDKTDTSAEQSNRTDMEIGQAEKRRNETDGDKCNEMDLEDV